MPETDFTNFYLVEDALETAFSTVLSAESLAVDKTRDSDDKVSPRVEVTVNLSEREDGDTLYESLTDSEDQYQRETTWRFEAVIRMVTNRIEHAATHPTYVKKCREKLGRYSSTNRWDSIFGPAVLPLHSIGVLRLQSTERGQPDDDRREDYTVDTYTGIVSWRVSALPASDEVKIVTQFFELPDGNNLIIA